MNPSSEREALRELVTSYGFAFHAAIARPDAHDTMRAKADHILETILQRYAALSAQPQQAGWQMVPIEPSTEMLAAIETPREFKFEVASHDCNVGIPAEVAAEIYAAMLNAAPLPPVPGQEGGTGE